jgi:uncharacterized protein YcbK (DUF882 family)
MTRCRTVPLLWLLVLVTRAGAAEPRFFVAGDGTLEIVGRATGERVAVRYRLADGSYDYAAIDEVRRLMRSKGGGEQGEITPRFVELLSYVQGQAGRPLVLLSGYRSPAYNAGLRRRGVRAANGSMHTEGLAADLAFPRDDLLPLWLQLRSLDCCGAGYYERQGFLHVDVGKPRFWAAATARTDEDLSGGNARLFARTDYDRYVAGEMILARLHGVTAPPVQVLRAARFVPESGRAATSVTVEEVGRPDGGGCIVADGATRLLVKGVPKADRGHVVFTTCDPRVERTPAEIETNTVALR